MRILFVNSVYGTGSTGRIVRDISQELLRRGHDTKVLYGRESPVADERSTQICSKIEFYSDVLMTRITGLHGCFSHIATKRLISELKDFKPDIIHLHNIHGYYLNFFKLIKYLKGTKIKVIWTLHDELMFTGKCSYAYECDKWLRGCSKCAQIKEYPRSLWFDCSKGLYQKKKKCFENLENFTLVTPSKWLADRVGKSILNSAKCVVINNGIDTESVFLNRNTELLRKQHNIGRKKVVLTVTDDVNSDRKGITDFIALADNCKKEEWLFFVVGGVRDDLKRENVIFVPCTNNQIELSEYYSMADIFVIPSKCDNFPTVCLEALACGTPIVGYNAGGIAETAPISRIGEFVGVEDIDSLEAAVVNMINSTSEETKEFCRYYAVNHYSKKKMIDKYIKLYKSVLGEE